MRVQKKRTASPWTVMRTVPKMWRGCITTKVFCTTRWTDPWILAKASREEICWQRITSKPAISLWPSLVFTRQMLDYTVALWIVKQLKETHKPMCCMWTVRHGKLDCIALYLIFTSQRWHNNNSVQSALFSPWKMQSESISLILLFNSHREKLRSRRPDTLQLQRNNSDRAHCGFWAHLSDQCDIFDHHKTTQSSIHVHYSHTWHHWNWPYADVCY